MQHFAFGDSFFRRQQVVQKLAQLAVVGHVAAENEPAVYVNDKKRIGPSAISTVDSTIEMIDDDVELDFFQTLQVARVRDLLFQRPMCRVIFRGMGLPGVK